MSGTAAILTGLAAASVALLWLTGRTLGGGYRKRPRTTDLDPDVLRATEAAMRLMRVLETQPPYSWGSDEELAIALWHDELSELPTASPTATFPDGIPAEHIDEWT